ncbi:stage II sporulation protein P [Clostridium sp. CF011]|uniref:stage II sporulation protein P n=1 Tax=Clostridium sp. CF011 TaxID=2843318 RepID=UPI001C0D0EC3|nr:stage II sporulation protein P [Clostridium sp. CF011]MBU3090710.1 stage II sporulation protein P [Clostridium sp. CF011]WAG70061.1 stage II sporulation protein P [Clostridium sp. CF011]
MSYKGIEIKGKYKNMLSKKTNFSKYAIKKNSNVRIFFCVFILLIIFLLSLILPKSAKADNEGKYRNYFYVNVINNTLAVIKSSNTEQQYTNSENSVKLSALSLLGVDILNPISIIVKEVAFLDNNDASSDVSNSKFSPNPFKLEDKQVSKSEAEAKDKDSNLVAPLDNPALKKALNNAKPRVLIYHSHTCEAYRTSDNDKSTIENSIDQTRNVCTVGDVIKDELEKKYGIAVIHDKTVHDKGDYNSAYKKSGVTLDRYLKEYEKFDLIIDLHRDSVQNKNAVTTKINGQNVAKFMFVVTDKNPRYAKQKKLINSMIGISNKLYPNLIKGDPIFAYHYGIGFYSQNKSDNAMLIEVGADRNTVSEVKNTGKYLSRIMAEQLNGKK